jgi:hypothetical protein
MTSLAVGKVLEVLDYAKDTLKVLLVVRSPWLGAVNALARKRRVDVEDHVDAGGIEDRHTLGVVQSRVDVVNTDSVHTELLHDNRITETHVGVRKGIFLFSGLVSGLTARLIVNTNNHQPFVCDCVNEVLPAHFNRVDCVSNAREQGREERERANKLSSR